MESDKDDIRTLVHSLPSIQSAIHVHAISLYLNNPYPPFVVDVNHCQHPSGCGPRHTFDQNRFKSSSVIVISGFVPLVMATKSKELRLFLFFFLFSPASTGAVSVVATGAVSS